MISISETAPRGGVPTENLVRIEIVDDIGSD